MVLSMLYFQTAKILFDRQQRTTQSSACELVFKCYNTSQDTNTKFWIFLVKVKSLIEPGKKYKRAQVIGRLRKFSSDIITDVGRNALAQMTTYKRLKVLKIHQDAFERGLGFEIGQYLFSRYKIYTDGMVLLINKLLQEVTLRPNDEIRLEDWLQKSDISEEFKYADLLKFEK